jgi:hypothetical protein
MESKYKLSTVEVSLAVRGLPVEIAEKIIYGNGYECRVMSKDHKSFMIEMDESNSRINIIIMAGIVTDAHPH